MLCRTHHQGSKSIWKDNSLVRYILLQIRTTFNWPVKHNVIVALCTYVCAFSHKTWLNLFFVCVPSHPLKLYSLSWWPRCINGFSVGFHSLLHNATLVSMTAINKTMVKRREKRKVSSIGWRCCPTKKKKKIYEQRYGNSIFDDGLSGLWFMHQHTHDLYGFVTLMITDTQEKQFSFHSKTAWW